MSRASCIAALNKENIELDKTQLDAIADTVEATINNANEQGNNVFDAVQKSLDEWADASEALINVVKRNEHLNFVARTNMESYINTHWADRPEEGFRTLITGVQTNRPGAKDSVAVLQQQIADRYIGAMNSELNIVMPDGTKPLDYVKPPAMGKNPHTTDVFKIMYHMNQDKPDASMWKGKPQGMVKAAEILLRTQETARKDANDSGSHQIAKLDNRVVRRTHDMVKMKAKGFDEWKKDMEEFGVLDSSDFNIKDWDDIARRHYNQTVSGERVVNPSSKPELTGIPGGMGNVSKSMTHARVFKFRDVDAELAYFKKYGKGDLLESVVFDLELSAQRIGLMRKLGPNARANFDAVADKIGYKLSLGDDVAKYAKFQKEVARIKRNNLPMVDGSIFVPGDAAIAKYGQIYRTFKMMALLGKAVLTSIVDVGVYASEVRGHGGSTMGGMFEAIDSVFTNKSSERDKVLAGLGVITNNMRNSTLSRFDPDHIMAGSHSRMAEIFFNLNLLTPWTDRLRTGFALSRANELAGLKNKSFDKLPDDWRRVLTQFNIEDAEWRVISKGDAVAADGKSFITPESIRDLDDIEITKYLETKGIPVNKSNIAKYRDDIADRFRSYFHSRAHTAALEPDAGSRAIMLQGTRAGTVEGEVVRMIGMFKSFPIAFLRQVVGREIQGRNSAVLSNAPDMIKALATDSQAMMGMAHLVVTTTFLGAIGLYLKDIADGRIPQELNSDNFGKFLTRAMLAGGALSIYGDFLLGETKNRYGGNAITTFLGPAAQDITNVSNIFGKLLSTDPDVRDAGADILNMIFRNVPGSNLFYTKMAYDYLIIYQLMELSNPGALKRMEARKKEQMNTEYAYPPSEVIPQGGGFPSF